MQLDVYGEPDIFVYFEMYITSTFHFHLPRLQVQTCTSPVDVSDKKKRLRGRSLISHRADDIAPVGWICTS